MQYSVFFDLSDVLSSCSIQFFVAVDYTVGDERLWYDKYSIRKPMLPSFIPLEMATKIQNIGKSINFIRHVCKDRGSVIRDEEKVLDRTKAEKNAGLLKKGVVFSGCDITSMYIRFLITLKFDFLFIPLQTQSKSLLAKS
jgi:hypothetical protein